MRSLFVVALPRSLSSVAYHASRLALGLAEPVWTSDGEILNNDRSVLYGGPTHDAGSKYVHSAAPAFQRVTAFLDQVACREGFAYKDVVQPFVAAAWLPASGLRVLRIHRRLADVAFSMLQMQWLYPALAAAPHGKDEEDEPHSLETAVIRGLLAAEAALQALPGEVVDFEDLIADESVLIGSLQRLYPDARVRGVRFIDESFECHRGAVLARRNEDEYQRIERSISLQQHRLEAPPACAAQPDLSPVARGERE
ncbi:MAG TPA: hypothetical protein VEG34_03260 [Thermoanaerobaculia bacterium]|nr:hypothetical protein [Thermoanaerobaculia bacterium]